MNTTQLRVLYEIQEVSFDRNLKLASLYITNIYTNVPPPPKKNTQIILDALINNNVKLDHGNEIPSVMYCTKIIFIATYKKMASLWEHLCPPSYLNFASNT
jgi:hypothetical protein